MDTYFNYEAIAKMLGLNYNQTYKLVQELDGLGFQIGKRRFFTETDLAKIKEHVAKRGFVPGGKNAPGTHLRG